MSSPEYIHYHGLLLPPEAHSMESLEYAQNFSVKDTDVFAVTYPKSDLFQMHLSMYLKCLPKKTHFGYDVMVHACSRSRVYKTFRARPVAVEKDYGYMKEMVADVLSSVSGSN